MEIDGMSALVTGAASGIGRAVAYALAKQGAKVFILDTNYVQAEQVARAINGIAYEGDVTSEESVLTVLGQLTAIGQAPRICVNCAGILAANRLIARSGPMSLDLFRKVIEVNLIGTFNVMRLLADVMSKQSSLNSDQEKGVIINTASIAAFEGQIGQVAYSASKGGVAAMTLPAARELSKFGIRVVTIAPGLIDTPMLGGLSIEAKTSLQNQTVFPKRLGKTEEFAQLVLHIIENVLINGTIIRLDGGLRLS